MPYFSSTVFFTAVLAATAASLTACFLLLKALFPALVDRAELSWTARPGSLVLTGIPSGGIAVALCLALLSAPHGGVKLAGLLLAGLALGVATVGASGLAALVGRRLSTRRDAAQPWMPMVRGGLVLEAAVLFPVLGWFLLLPLLVAAGFAAGFRALWPARQAHPASSSLGA